MHLKITKVRLTAPALFVLAGTLIASLVVVNVLLTVRSARQLKYDAAEVSHSYQVIDGLDRLLSLIKDAETGERGFVITGDPRYLEPYTVAVQSLDRQLANLEELNTDDSWRQRRFPAIRDVIAGKLTDMSGIVALTREAGLEAARREILAGRGKAEMDSLRSLIGAMTAHEQNILAERNQDAEHAYTNAILTAIFSMIFTLLAVGTVLILQGRGHMERKLASERSSLNADAAESMKLLLTQSEQLTIELRQSNEELSVRAALLAGQKTDVERKIDEIEQSRLALESKVAELALASKYKSEFLANMSHELRTPLNSILILSQHLAENSACNLSAKQVEFSRNINSSGVDLLSLINDILDLSKIESGTVVINVEHIGFRGLRDDVERAFRHVAALKNLPFRVLLAQDLPGALYSDPKRLHQILKNLLSNALKFTTSGHVELRVGFATRGWTPGHAVLSVAPGVLAFAVEDTGIGVPLEKQRLIFEAFQQADAGTSRKYGGSGLGLAISRELAALLGGEIQLVSTPGRGSTFTLFLPLHYAGPEGAPDVRANPAVADTNPGVVAFPMAQEVQIEDDIQNISPGDAVLLIIEDDPQYARILLGVAREKGFKCLVVAKGATGLALAREFRPTAISLDILLPDMLGWTVLNQLKLDPATRHIPVQIVTINEERPQALTHGVFAYIVKSPTTEGLHAAIGRMKEFTLPRTRRLLIVEDNGIERQAIFELLGHGDIEIVAASTGSEAMRAMQEKPFDCVVLDLRLPDMSGFDLLEQLQADPVLSAVPVVIFTGKQLDAGEEQRLNAMARSIVLKDVQSPERLFDETALFLHRVVADLPADKQLMLNRLHGSNDMLRGRKILVVDDDARNIFALTSLLENQEMDVISATSGRAAIDIIRNTADLGIVLMDIMMPDMDGYETMREIRQFPKFRNLPILALTARAMSGDRQKCLDAGASDYIAKPVDNSQLISLIRGWLVR